MEPGSGRGWGAASKFLKFMQEGCEILVKAANTARCRKRGGLCRVETPKSKLLNFSNVSATAATTPNWLFKQDGNAKEKYGKL